MNRSMAESWFVSAADVIVALVESAPGGDLPLPSEYKAEQAYEQRNAIYPDAQDDVSLGYGFLGAVSGSLLLLLWRVEGAVLLVVVDPPLGHFGRGKDRAEQGYRGACVGEWVFELPEGLRNAQVTKEGDAYEHSYDYERAGQS